MKRIAALLLAACVLLIAGCSTFPNEWEKALASRPTDAFAGPWTGTWKSEPTGHSGPLRCLVTGTGPRQYTARFRAGWGPGLQFEYTVQLAATREGGMLKLAGEQDIGWACGYGGVYKYTGTVAHGDFTATYQAKNDHGTFQLKRPQ